MAFTPDQERKLIDFADSIDENSFKQIIDLPTASSGGDNKMVEVFNSDKLRSEKMPLKAAVAAVGGGGGLSDEEREQLEYASGIQGMTEEELDLICV